MPNKDALKNLLIQIATLKEEEAYLLDRIQYYNPTFGELTAASVETFGELPLWLADVLNPLPRL